MTVEIVLFHSELTIALQSPIPYYMGKRKGNRHETSTSWASESHMPREWISHVSRMDLTRLASGSHTLRETVIPLIIARVQVQDHVEGGCFAFHVVAFCKSMFFGVKKHCNYSLKAIIYLNKSLLTLQFYQILTRSRVKRKNFIIQWLVLMSVSLYRRQNNARSDQNVYYHSAKFIRNNKFRPSLCHTTVRYWQRALRDRKRNQTYNSYCKTIIKKLASAYLRARIAYHCKILWNKQAK